MAIQDELAAIVSTLRIGVVGDSQPQALEPVRSKVMPDIPALDVTTIIQAPLDNLKIGIKPTTVVEKGVRFSDAFPEAPSTDTASSKETTYDDLGDAANVLGGMPISTLNIAGVPGLVRQLSGVVLDITGNIPIPVKAKVPVTMLVKWSVTDENGTVLAPGDAYRAPEGLDVATPSFLFLPSFTEATPPPPATVTRQLRAAVKLIAGGVSYPDDPANPDKMVPLPNVIDIKVPSIPLTPLLMQQFSTSLAKTTLDPGETGLAHLTQSQVPNLFTRIQELFPEVEVSVSSAVVKGSAQPTWSTWDTSSPLTFHLRPELQALSPAPVGGNWNLRVRLAVSGLPHTQGDVTVELPAVPLVQLPVLLPLVVAGFEKRHWEGGDMILFVDPKNGLVSNHLDARHDSAAVDTAKQLVLTPLDVAVGFLTKLLPLFPDLLSDLSGQLTTLKEFVNHIRVRVPSRIVITGEGRRDDLGTYQSGWSNRLSSVLMIGAPGGSTFKLFEDTAQKSHELHMRVPSTYLAASYWTLHESAFHKDNRESYSSPPVVPEPGVYQQGRSENYPFGSFGNMAKSFRWE